MCIRDSVAALRIRAEEIFGPGWLARPHGAHLGFDGIDERRPDGTEQHDGEQDAEPGQQHAADPALRVVAAKGGQKAHRRFLGSSSG